MVGTNSSNCGIVSHRSLDTVILDHCYSKPWTSYPGACNCKPLKTLFTDELCLGPISDANNPYIRHDNGILTNALPIASTSELTSAQTRHFTPTASDGEQIESDNLSDEIDVVNCDEVKEVDVSRCKRAMLECEHQVNSLLPAHAPGTDITDDWEEHIQRLRCDWTIRESKLFNRVMKILYSDYLSKLASVGVDREVILRRLHVDQCADKFRLVMSSVAWAPGICQC